MLEHEHSFAVCLDLPVDATQVEDAFMTPWSSIRCFTKAVRAALYTICADGGANRLFDLSPTWRQASAAAIEYIPDLIKGDMDSIRQEVVDHYSGAGSR